MGVRPYNSYMMAGVVLILLGLIFFAAKQGTFNLNWGTIWPAFPMLAGVLVLVQSATTGDANRRAGMVMGGMIPLLIGVFFFTFTLGLFSWGDMATLWPMFPLIVGVAFFARNLASDREENNFLLPGAILTGVAMVLLAVLQLGGPYGVTAKLWPIFLIIAGVLMLVPGLRKSRG
ncbi:MAG TPA: DUF5668 domain-containing protein [Chloroflexia bacterium]|nr:DUF5668 domain-containing protein [Chloroflexia bacterium]